MRSEINVIQKSAYFISFYIPKDSKYNIQEINLPHTGNTFSVVSPEDVKLNGVKVSGRFSTNIVLKIKTEKK